MNREQFEKEFNALPSDEDKQDVQEAWERQMKKAGIDLPQRGKTGLARYVWKLRAMVIEHKRTHEPPWTPRRVCRAIERCRMTVQPMLDSDSWLAYAFPFKEKDLHTTVQAERETLAEAVAACAEAYDEALEQDGSETKGQ